MHAAIILSSDPTQLNKAWQGADFIGCVHSYKVLPTKDHLLATMQSMNIHPVIHGWSTASQLQVLWWIWDHIAIQVNLRFTTD